MNINIEAELDNNEIMVKFESECIQNQIYKLGESVDLTDLVKHISNANNYIEINPENFEDFKENIKCEDKEILTIIEYIYKIFDAYNKSYQEVCADKETEN